MAHLKWQKITVVYAASLALMVVLTGLDWLTGPDIHSELFFVIPVLVAGYYLSRRHVVILSLLSAAAFMVAGNLVARSDHWVVDAFQAVGSFLELLVIGLAVAAVRSERDALRAANARITQLLEQEAQLARTDALTGLPNLREFTDRLPLDIARTARGGTNLWLMMLDLDNFKQVNDRHGHAAGDEALKAVAELLRTHTRSSDLAARVGGDEFAVLLWDANEDEARAVARRLAEGAHEIGLRWPGTGFGASAGVVHLPPSATNATELLKLADTAMYEAKNKGKGTVVVHGVNAAPAPVSPEE